MKKVAIVTGSTKGIGKSIAAKLADDGFHVVLFGRDLKKLKKLAHLLSKKGSGSIYFSGDVADPDFVTNCVKEIKKRYKRIDVLINNAGVAIFEKFTDSNLDNFQRQIDTNVIGVYNFSKAVIDLMIKKKAGTIINIVSIAGKNGFQFGTTYSATKHAVMGFSKSLMQEVRKYNIRVIAICPGSVDTDMISDSPIHSATSKMLKPIDVAELVSFSIKLPTRVLLSEVDIRPNNP